MIAFKKLVAIAFATTLATTAWAAGDNQAAGTDDSAAGLPAKCAEMMPMMQQMMQMMSMMQGQGGMMGGQGTMGAGGGMMQGQPGMMHDQDDMMQQRGGGMQGNLSDASKAYMKAMRDMDAPMMMGMQSSDPDIAFVKSMIPHHQGAIDMAKAVLEYGKDEKVRKWAKQIIAAQESEIAEMKAWLDKHDE
jgi:uncharacterized protein (DUF305 family)